MIEVSKVHKGDKVRFNGEVGVVKQVDHDDYVVLIDFAPDDPAVNGEMEVSVDEPGIELTAEGHA